MRHITAEDIARTKQTLLELAARQDRLGVQLAGLHLGFLDGMDWLATQRTQDEALAEKRKWRILRRRYEGSRSVPTPARTAVAFDSLSVPRPRKHRFTEAQERVAAAWAERQARAA